MLPENEELLAAARRAYTGDRIEEAETLSRKALDANPEEFQALLLLGMVASKKGRLQESEALLRRALSHEPNSFDAILWLAIALRNQRRPGEALPYAERACQLRPDDVRGQYQLAIACMETGRFEEADRALVQAVVLDPKAAALQELHGRTLQVLGREEDAIEAFRRASNLDPTNERILSQLAFMLIGHFEGAAAVKCVRRILKLNPTSTQDRLLLARALLADQKGEEALDVVLGVLKEDPGSALAELEAGRMLHAMGRFDEACEHYRRSIELIPSQGHAYSELAQAHRFIEADRPLVERMETLIARVPLPPVELAPLHYALGKAYDDLGEFENAMRNFDQANKIQYSLKFGDRPFDWRGLTETNDLIMHAFSREFLAAHVRDGVEDELPLFVIGMMRSGTTLTDQILSCHPEIGTANEKAFWIGNRSNAFDIDMALVNVPKLRELAAQYHELLSSSAPGKRRVVDKMPTNYSVLGLIRVAYPNARIIHVNRHPVDTCISIYSTPNSTKAEWSHNKENIVFAYREYQRLMSHWREVFPEGSILEISYEDLIGDREATTRKLIDFSGLEWSDLCLRPEANQRTVTTPSAWQVRQPIFSRSVERWRNYEPWLGAFRDLLT